MENSECSSDHSIYSIPVRKDNESQRAYQKRLHVYCISLASLAEMVEEEISLSRYRDVLPLSRRLDMGEDSEAVEEIKALASHYLEDIKSYSSRHPEIFGQEKVAQKRDSIVDILRS